MVLGQRDSSTDAQLGRGQRGREVEGGGVCQWYRGTAGQGQTATED